jgi:hypothetical protein
VRLEQVHAVVARTCVQLHDGAGLGEPARPARTALRYGHRRLGLAQLGEQLVLPGEQFGQDAAGRPRQFGDVAAGERATTAAPKAPSIAVMISFREISTCAVALLLPVETGPGSSDPVRVVERTYGASPSCG